MMDRQPSPPGAPPVRHARTVASRALSGAAAAGASVDDALPATTRCRPLTLQQTAGLALSARESRALLRRRAPAWGRTATIPAVCCVAVVLTYGPLAFFRFAHTDDYALLMIHGFRAVNPFWIGDGRILGGLLCAALFTLFDTVSSAAILRLIGLAELLCCLALIQRAARTVGLDPGWAAVATLLFAASPSIQNWMVWGVSSWQMPALLLGLLAYGPWRRLFDAAGRVSWVDAAAFVALQVAALLVYQPFAFSAWPFIGLALVAECDDASALRRGAASLATLAAVLVAALLITKGMTALFVPAGGHDRTEVATLADLPGKLWWLTSTLYPTVLSYVTATPAWAVCLPAAALIGAHLAARSGGPSRTLLVVAAIAAAAAAAALPSLATPEVTPIRTFVVPALLASLLAGSALQALCRGWRAGAAWVRVAAASACAASLGVAGYVCVFHVAIPQRDEIDAVESRLSRDALPTDRPLVLVGPPVTASITGRDCGAALIGCASSSRRFALPNMVRLWLRDHGRNTRPGEIFFAADPGAASVFSFEPDRSKDVPRPPDAHILDFRELPRPR